MKIKQSELDAAIAVAVMEWEPSEKMGAILYRENGKLLKRCSGRQFGTVEMFTPSTDLNHAFEALEKWRCDEPMRRKYELFHDGCYLHSEWEHVDVSQYGEIKLAICLALLSAVRGEQVTLEDEA